jgi:hypothetical protein
MGDVNKESMQRGKTRRKSNIYSAVRDHGRLHQARRRSIDRNRRSEMLHETVLSQPAPGIAAAAAAKTAAAAFGNGAGDVPQHEPGNRICVSSPLLGEQCRLAAQVGRQFIVSEQ